MFDQVAQDSAPVFDHDFSAQLEQLFIWRRDVRRFLTRAVAREDMEALLATAALSPSVGNCQPWRFAQVDDRGRRGMMIGEFERCNHDALHSYSEERADQYARLKLEGLREAPVHLAVFCDEETKAGHDLGRATMPETARYSVVMAIHTLWLAARARGLGVGWVSILDPDRVKSILEVPQHWRFIAYLCIGYPQEEHRDPELVRHGWQDRAPLESFILER
jgi:5,6-dimethylbenzimidazole synthase